MGVTRQDADLNFLGLSRILNLPASTANGHAVRHEQLQEALSQIAALQSSLQTPDPLDASANPNYPASVAGANYLVTVEGKIGGGSGIDVEVGDWIICKDDSVAGDHATVGSNFFIIQRNVVQATEAVLGFAALATTSEAQLGTNDTKIMTPLKVAQAITAQSAAPPHTQTIGDAIAQSFVIVHNRGRLVCSVVVWDTVNNNLVDVAITFNTTNQLTITTNSVPANGQYSIVVY
jgi:hypothetical protein